MTDDRFPATLEELRAFVDERVRKALHEGTRDLRPRTTYTPPRLEVKDAALSGRLPAWARHEEGTGEQ